MNVCFIGTGSIGKRHIKNLIKVCANKDIDVNIDVYRHSKTPLSDEIISYINAEIFSEKDLKNHYDIVFITNPTNMHYKTLSMFKNLSSAFFIEKPLFELNIINYRDLELDENKKYYVACPLRHTKVLTAAKNILQNERIYSVRSICSSYLPDWRPGIDYRKVYSASEETSGGICFDLIHEWDYLVDLFGFPTDVNAIKGHYSNLEIKSDDIALYLAKYENMLIELHIDYFGRETIREFEVFSENATWRINIKGGTIEKNGVLIEKFIEEPNDKYIREMEYFMDYFNNKKTNINSIDHAWKLMKII